MLSLRPSKSFAYHRRLSFVLRAITPSHRTNPFRSIASSPSFSAKESLPPIQLTERRLPTGDAVAHLELANPRKRNPLSFEALSLLHEHIQAISASRHLRAVVISAQVDPASKTPVFSSGHDLSELDKLAAHQESQKLKDLFALCSSVCLSLRKLRQPVIAQVHGLATAAGCQLVASCDLVVCTRASAFATPGVRIGLFCSTPAVPLIRALSSPKKAMEMLLTGDPISAEEAERYGLVNRVVSAPEQLPAEVEKLLLNILKSSDAALARKREFYTQSALPSMEQAFAATEPLMVCDVSSADSREGISAFLQKRKPEWTSK